MTGKELMLVLGGAVALGGGAAATYAVVGGQDQAPAPRVDTSELEARIEGLEKNQLRTAKALERIGDRIGRISEEVTKTRIEAAKAATAQRPPAGPGFPGFVHRGGTETEEGTEVRTGVRMGGREGGAFTLGEGIALSGDKLKALGGEEMAEAVQKALEGVREQLGSEDSPLAGMLKGFELRKLPKEERWAKAQEDLNLSPNQVDDLKSAAADFDEEMKGAMVTEKTEAGNGGTFTVRRTDFEKAAAARKRYQERVDQSLDTDQRKKWKDDGYANAFGSPGGTTTAISVGSFQVDTTKTEKTQDEE
jgi:hypothetical protein